MPDRAIGNDQAGRYVLVVDKDNVVEQRQVEIGVLVNGMRVIENGLTADDWVVADGIQRAIPGSKVDAAAARRRSRGARASRRASAGHDLASSSSTGRSSPT